MDKITINSPIIVEGKYDKIKLESFIDGLILCSDGFRIFKNKEKLAMLRRLGQESGIIILTDSDVAGFKLRGFIKQCLKDINVTNLYIPQVVGKEKRKAAPSKQGLLGVEGIDVSTLREIFAQQISTTAGTALAPIERIERADFYRDGFIGKENSSALRQKLLLHLNLPSYISTNSLLQIINRVMTKEQYLNFRQKEEE